jgi:ribosomal protein L29
MKNRTDLSALSDAELVHRSLDLERTLAGHQLRHRIGKLENNSVLGATRRDIARANTEIRRRELASQGVNGSLRSAHLGSWKPAAATQASEAGGGFLKSMLDEAPKAE